MPDSPLQIEVSDAVAWLRLNRPGALNAINREMIDSLAAALTVVEEDPEVRVLVVTGNGRAFCSGADLNELLGPDGIIDPDEIVQFVRYSAGVVARIQELTIPAIAAVNGIAVGGGLGLALACDLIVASQSASFGDAHANFGLVPSGGSTARLARLVGPVVAKYMAFTGDPVPATELVPLGVVNAAVPDEDLLGCARELAAKVSSKSARGIAHMKRLINDSLEQPLATARRLEHLTLAEHLHSGDVREGLVAFREKRKPEFSGL